MDLESTNGTLLNKLKIERARYYEILNYDILNFGFSSLDYVIIKVDNENEEIKLKR
jgi:smad nuclear-interacting protein 1